MHPVLKVLIAVATMLVLGFILGFIISLVSAKFHVEEDKRLEELIKLLPGANCGACGNPGCSAYANKILEKESDGNSCTVIKGENKEALLNYIKENI